MRSCFTNCAVTDGSSTELCLASSENQTFTLHRCLFGCGTLLVLRVILLDTELSITVLGFTLLVKLLFRVGILRVVSGNNLSTTLCHSADLDSLYLDIG